MMLSIVIQLIISLSMVRVGAARSSPSIRGGNNNHLRQLQTSAKPTTSTPTSRRPTSRPSTRHPTSRRPTSSRPSTTKPTTRTPTSTVQVCNNNVHSISSYLIPVPVTLTSKILTQNFLLHSRQSPHHLQNQLF